MSNCLSTTPTVYGPVISRRLGASLGINLFPADRRICSYDCVYCECGSPRACAGDARAVRFPPVDELRSETDRCFRDRSRRGERVDAITFAGNGEPTVYPWFPAAVEVVQRLRDVYFPDVPLAIFSNATRLREAAIRNAMRHFDRRFMKVDAGDEKTFRLVDRPMAPVSLDEIVAAIADLDSVELSTAVVEGSVCNISSLMSEGFVSVVKKIKPIGLYLYPIDRPAASDALATADMPTLEVIRAFLQDRVSVPVMLLQAKKNRPDWYSEAYGRTHHRRVPTLYTPLMHGAHATA